ncbi:HAMP domain-containing sensor histidine kinase [Actinocrispum sp. NPDC049592]|uniref:sensor histidine kinase n=1 Tax=Actinocrispum sp. NPDC049592 TaxID=3154835 RepID=UPI003428527A
MAGAARAERRRRGLRVRLLAGSVLVAVCSVGATAWLSVQSTTGTLQAEQVQNRATVARIYDGVLGYAATHPSWNGVAPVLADLGRETGLRIGLTAGNRVPIAGAFGPDDPPLPAQPSAVVDPLAVDVTLQANAPDDRIDARAVGPFRLQPQERDQVRAEADQQLACMQKLGVKAEVVVATSGRSFVRPDPVGACAQPPSPTLTEKTGLDILDSYVGDCLKNKGSNAFPTMVTASGGFTPARPGANRQTFLECLTSSRQLLLTPYTSPAALLFISVPPTTMGLPAAGAVRILGAALVIIVLTVGVSLLLAGRVLRPLRALTAATQRMRAGDRAARAEVSSRWEIAELADAFNQMSEHLARTETQRKNLVSDVSHELRTPLGTIRGWLVAAQDGVAELDPALVESLLEETLVLQQLVDDLHELASADAGEFRLHVEPMDAGELLAQVAAVHPRPLAVETSGDLQLTADPVRLRQAVGNLVTNAIQHTPPDGRIVLRGRRAGGEIVLEVSDTGSGIAAEHLPHVFDRFWRADPSRSRATGGRGLGLAIVKHLVEAHGGTVTVDSGPGAGTTFTLRLPAKEPE